VRLVTNPLIEAWHGNESELRARLPEAVSAFQKALTEQDFNVVTPIVGEAISLIHDVRPAADIVREMISDATRTLNRAAQQAQYSGDQSEVRSRRLSHWSRYLSASTM
jgi:nitronate monooxygenase